MVTRCLEKECEERFQSARDLAFALRQAATGIRGITASAPRAHVGEVPSPAIIREHLGKVLASSPIAGAQRLSALLRFVV